MDILENRVSLIGTFIFSISPNEGMRQQRRFAAGTRWRQRNSHARHCLTITMRPSRSPPRGPLSRRRFELQHARLSSQRVGTKLAPAQNLVRGLINATYAVS